MVNYQLILVLFLVFIFSSCLVDMELSMSRRENNSNLLTLDGYYYHRYVVEGSKFTGVWFLYKNGNLFDAGSQRGTPNVSIMDAHVHDAYIDIEESHKKYIQPEYTWGLYHLTEGKIEIERYQTPLYARPYTTIEEKGVVLNDTTFVITKRFIHETNSEESVQDTFHFRKFSLKPDSVNRFINKQDMITNAEK